MLKITDKTIIDQERNIVELCREILRDADVNNTRYSISRDVSGHLEPFSLLAVQDILKKYGVDSVGVRLGQYTYVDFETPFVCALQRDYWPNPALTVVKAVDESEISFWDPEENRLQIIPVDEFRKIDKEVVLLLDDSNKHDEENYEQHIQKERQQQNFNRTFYTIGTVLICVALFAIYTMSSTFSWLALTFLINSSVGLLISSMLIWHEVDAFHPFLKEVCGGFGKKTDCNAVLSSSGSSFLGLSWSAWGFAYFVSFFIAQFFFVINPVGYYLLVYSSLLVSPYIFYSLFYQARIVKQWCPLCLLVQAVLLINAIASIIFLLPFDSVFIDLNWTACIPIVLLFLGFALLTHKPVPLLKDAKKSKDVEKRWKRLRYNPDVFQALLEKSDKVTQSAEGLGIVVGNPEAKTEVIKVCNPYCGPCAKAHPELEAVIHKNTDVKLRIIFTATGEKGDNRSAPVAHLLAVQQIHGAAVVKQALDDWYLAKEKNYDVFAAKYPMNGELAMQTQKMASMKDWCDIMKIRATPTVFINGSELPDGYQISELKNIL